MSNFLNRLISKSLNGAEEIQPRPVSLFEPPTPFSRLLQQAVDANESGADPRLEITTLVSKPLLQSPSISAASSPTLRHPLGTGVAAPLTPDLTDATTPSTLRPAPEQWSQPSAVANSQANLIQRKKSPSSSLSNNPLPNSIQPPNLERSPQAMTRESVSAPSDPQPHSQSIQSSIIETSQLELESASLRSIRSAIQISSDAAVEAGTRPQIKPLVQTETQPLQSDQPPIIRITIDRIDVRAVPPPPSPPSRRPPPAPKLSLADYLKQRPGGGT